MYYKILEPSTQWLGNWVNVDKKVQLQQRIQKGLKGDKLSIIIMKVYYWLWE